MAFTIYTTLPHNLIKDKLIDLIKITFQRGGYHYLASNDRNAFFTSKKPKKISGMILSKCMLCADLIVLTTFLYDLALNCIDKL